MSKLGTPTQTTPLKQLVIHVFLSSTAFLLLGGKGNFFFFVSVRVFTVHKTTRVHWSLHFVHSDETFSLFFGIRMVIHYFTAKVGTSQSQQGGIGKH